ncbi:HAD family hydrolase [Nonomuraea jabiensis]|uniref:HAD superfamily hydrolase (TIGR01509 family) n=1 Tax=Nonomuraea jabiensis TaxID=882448 RepID=A0A7W9FXK5_9ACTN|nr:HAD family phosphatase [Nonomuraea jabiensis]MBB5773349.1 HAD superfamily hydrolase (TIGR01509 family) [Nonomuraea jabiensis]
MRSEHAGPDAVLFDMDGTLVDTEGLWWQATVSVAASLGRALGAEDMPYVLGRTAEDVATHLLTPAPETAPSSRHNPSPDPETAPPPVARPGRDTPLMVEVQVVRQLTDAFADLIEQGVKVTPGASELLAELAATAIPTALVTASPRTIVELVLPRLGHTFDLVIANEDTARGKPHPDPYLEAARRLGTTPSRCVAVEDSPTGVAAATAAGCRVLVTSPEKGLPSLTHLLADAHPPEG